MASIYSTAHNLSSCSGFSTFRNSMNLNFCTLHRIRNSKPMDIASNSIFNILISLVEFSILGARVPAALLTQKHAVPSRLNCKFILGRIHRLSSRAPKGHLHKSYILTCKSATSIFMNQHFLVNRFYSSQAVSIFTLLNVMYEKFIVLSCPYVSF